MINSEDILLAFAVEDHPGDVIEAYKADYPDLAEALDELWADLQRPELVKEDLAELTPEESRLIERAWQRHKESRPARGERG